MNSQLELIEQHFGKIAVLIGEKSRAIMLWNLLDGRAYTATELAICADISKQACSNHLAKLVAGKLLTIESQGRHKYYRFANDRVAHVVENIAYLLPDLQYFGEITLRPAEGIKIARTCYDHLAGSLGVKIATALVKKEIVKQKEAEYVITTYGKSWFQALDIDLHALQLLKRRFAYPCLDWSERKHHIAGAVGAALLKTFVNKDWIRKKNGTRELSITPIGKMKISECLHIDVG